MDVNVGSYKFGKGLKKKKYLESIYQIYTEIKISFAVFCFSH